MAISYEKGLEYSEIFDFSIDIPKFEDYLVSLRRKNRKDKLCLYIDNLKAHTSRRVKRKMDELGMRYIYNCPYSPDLNAVESTFSILKNTIKKLRTRALVLKKKV